MLNEEMEFHKERIAFAIINKELLFLENSTMSHEQWLVETGIITNLEFDEITRGFVKDNEVYFYKGDFETSEKVEKDSLIYLNSVCVYCKIPIPNVVYCGMNKGAVGTLWTPIVEITVESQY